MYSKCGGKDRGNFFKYLSYLYMWWLYILLLNIFIFLDIGDYRIFLFIVVV